MRRRLSAGWGRFLVTVVALVGAVSCEDRPNTDRPDPEDPPTAEEVEEMVEKTQERVESEIEKTTETAATGTPDVGAVD